MKLRKVSLVSVLLVLIWAIVAVGEEKDPIFPKLFPQNTFLVISFPDISNTRADFQKTSLYELINEPEIRDLIYEFIDKPKFEKELALFSDRLKTASGLTLDEIISIFSGEVSIALTSIPQGSQPINVAITIQFKNRGQEVHKLMDAITEKVSDFKESYKINETEVFYLKEMETPFYYTVLKEYFIFATNQDLMNQMLGNLQKQGSTMANSTKFKEYCKNMDRGSSFLMYLDLEQLCSAALSTAGDEIKRIADILGISRWQTLGISFSIQDKQIQSRWYLSIKGDWGQIPAKQWNKPLDPHKTLKSLKDLIHKKELIPGSLLGAKGIASLFPSGDLNVSVGKYIPADTCFWGVVSLKVERIWKEFKHCFEEINPEIFNEAMRELNRFERGELQFTIDDLADCLGNDYALFHLPDPVQKFPPSLVAVVKAKHYSKMFKILNKFAEFMGYTLKSEVYRGRTVYYLDSKAHVQKREFVYVDPNLRQTLRLLFGNIVFFVDKEFLILSRLPQTLMDLIDYYEAKKPAIDLGNFLPKGHTKYSMLIYINWQALFPPIYGTILPLTPQIEDSMGLWFRLKATDLPRVSTITKHLSPNTLSLENKGETIVLSLRTNLGIEFFSTASAILAWINDMARPGFSGFFERLDRYLILNQETSKLVREQRYYQISRDWKDFEDNSYFSYFRMIASQKYKALNEEYEKRCRELKETFVKHFPPPYLSTMDFTGDWKLENGVLSAENSSSQDYWIITGGSPISEYILEFEVKDIKNNFQAIFHSKKLGDNKRDYENTVKDYESVTISEIKGLEGKWIPLKFKVHEGRISYWFGLTHNVINTDLKEGFTGFLLPASGSVILRNIKLTVKPKKLEQEQEFPKIQLECSGPLDCVNAGEETTYKVTAQNHGKKQASDTVVAFIIPSQMKFVSASGANFQMSGEDTVIFGPFTLNPEEKQRFDIVVNPVTPGSATVQATLKFAGLNGEIVIKKRTHIIK